MSARIVKMPLNKDALLDDAVQVVLAVKSEANGNIEANAKSNGYDYKFDKDALDKFEESYEYDKDQYANYDNCSSQIIETLLGLIMCLVNVERPNQKWWWTELGIKPTPNNATDGEI